MAWVMMSGVTVHVDEGTTLYSCPACGIPWRHTFVMEHGAAQATCCGALLRVNPMPFPKHVMGRSGAW